MSEQNSVNLRLYAEAVPYLMHWFLYNKRSLPWREEPTPYHVFVSEIMLQQTRVEAVRGYYDRFLRTLPDIAALAYCDEELLLKLWEGLGYYSRVRNMQRCARIVMEQYGGELPADFSKLVALPGIGDYTAGAIASIAFSLPYPAVDGNVLRVMSRLTCNEEDITKDTTKKKLKEDLTKIMPDQPGDFNQSLMELGATVCLPNGKPLCDQCPIMHLCRAFHEGRTLSLPVKAEKKKRTVARLQVFLVYINNRLLLHKRADKGLLAGLWELPNRSAREETEEESLRAILRSRFPDCVVRKQKREAKHVFSHIEWQMQGVRLELHDCDALQERRFLAFIKELCQKNGENLGDHLLEEQWVLADEETRRTMYSVPTAFEVLLKADEKCITKEQGDSEMNLYL